MKVKWKRKKEDMMGKYKKQPMRSSYKWSKNL